MKYWLTPKFKAIMTNGKPVMNNKQAFYDYCSQKYKEGTELEIRIAKWSEKQTHDQYEYLYSCIYEPFRQANEGWTLEDVDEFMKEKFIKAYGIVLPKGMTLSKAANFNKEWISKYIDACIKVCIESGVEVLEAK